MTSRRSRLRCPPVNPSSTCSTQPAYARSRPTQLRGPSPTSWTGRMRWTTLCGTSSRSCSARPCATAASRPWSCPCLAVWTPWRTSRFSGPCRSGEIATSGSPPCTSPTPARTAERAAAATAVAPTRSTGSRTRVTASGYPCTSTVCRCAGPAGVCTQASHTVSTRRRRSRRGSACTSASRRPSALGRAAGSPSSPTTRTTCTRTG
mmetsp:Transcript_70462/g.196086  ORF Transcript_70462/g.196086 Transcript_70462/m.196086 type:complete len:206 (+) Transcript_70462:310-927(+)